MNFYRRSGQQTARPYRRIRPWGEQPAPRRRQPARGPAEPFSAGGRVGMPATVCSCLPGQARGLRLRNERGPPLAGQRRVHGGV